MSFTLVTVTGTYKNPDGTAATGTVEFRLNQVLTNGATMLDLAVVKAPLVAGAISVTLEATDDTGTRPSGGTYTVVEKINGAYRDNEYVIVLPHSPSSLDLSTVTPSTSVPVYTYALASDLAELEVDFNALFTDNETVAGLWTWYDGGPDYTTIDPSGITSTDGTGHTVSIADGSISVVGGTVVVPNATLGNQALNITTGNLLYDALGDAAAVQTNLDTTNTTVAEIEADLGELPATYQPLDSDLTAIAALSTTSFGRALLTLADAAAGRTSFGLGGLAVLSTITSAEITDGTIVNADINAAAAIAYSKLNLASSVTSADIVDGTIVNADVNAAAAIVYTKLSLANSILNADINAAAAIAYSKLNLAGSIVSADIVDGTIVNADINAAAAIAYAKLSLANSIVNADIGAAAAIAYSKLNLAGSIVSADITDGTLVNADINASAAIAYSKLALSASIVSADIVDGTLVNADINAAAAIAYSKLNLSASIVSADIVDGTLVNADISAAAAIAYSKLNLASSIVSADIVDGTLTNADHANMTAKTFKARHTNSTGAPEDVSAANVMADLSGQAAAAFDLANQKITTLATGTATTDAVNLGQLTGVGIYGDSSDGVVTINAGTTTLASDKCYLTLTVTGTLVTSGWRVRCSGTVSGAGIIAANGASATTATGATGASGIAGTISGGAGGGTGTATGTGGNGTSLASSALGGAGGNGGNGTGGRNGGTGGSITTNPANVGLMRHVPESVLGIFLSAQGGTANLATTNALLRSGAGGAGGAGDGTNAGGGGGAGGNVLLLAARNIDFSSGLVLQAKGGNGANGVAGNSGGGGGGGGGVILITYSTVVSYVAGTNSVVTGGSKGLLTGSGSTNGIDGSGGLVITVLN